MGSACPAHDTAHTGHNGHRRQAGTLRGQTAVSPRETPRSVHGSGVREARPRAPGHGSPSVQQGGPPAQTCTRATRGPDATAKGHALPPWLPESWGGHSQRHWCSPPPPGRQAPRPRSARGCRGLRSRASSCLCTTGRRPPHRPASLSVSTRGRPPHSGPESSGLAPTRGLRRTVPHPACPGRAAYVRPAPAPSRLQLGLPEASRCGADRGQQARTCPASGPQRWTPGNAQQRGPGKGRASAAPRRTTSD